MKNTDHFVRFNKYPRKRKKERERRKDDSILIHIHRFIRILYSSSQSTEHIHTHKSCKTIQIVGKKPTKSNVFVYKILYIQKGERKKTPPTPMR